ncbi:MAG TPA: TniB family NTP-binding protein [Methylotenera sp.]|nr:TniB family NTP-binding protein [Methylotenera sp.]
MSDYKHLSESACEVMNLSNQERIHHILKDRWVGYDRANELLTKLDDLIAHPKVERMPNMLIIGDSNNGKTRLINYFASKNPAHDNPSGENISVPVLLLEAPSNGDINHLYKKILDILISPYKPNTKSDALEEQVIKVLSKIDLGIIVIDEIHNLLTGSAREQRHFLTALKSLGNLLQVPIVGVGTEEAFRAFLTDPQISNRFVAERLAKWKLDNQFLRFLASIERIIPLRDSSNLIEKDIATKIYAMTEGLIGEISTLLNKAAVWAIKHSKPGQAECITMDALNKCGYISPSVRVSHQKN